jgi:hypothetical protein
LWGFSADFALSQKWPGENIYLFWKYFAHNYFLSTSFFMQEKVKKIFFANTDSKTTRIRQIHQQKTNQSKIGQIRQKSARNWKSARNIFCPPGAGFTN